MSHFSDHRQGSVARPELYREAMSEAPTDASSPLDVLAVNARSELSLRGWPIDEAPAHVPSQPGLYAIHAPRAVWVELGLAHLPSTPLYVGKAQKSLAGRDLRDHFATGTNAKARTGGSTVRRSFAALLRERLNLRGVPRNKSRPERFANFGLELDADERLTAWMHANLTLAFWGAPTSLPSHSLTTLETTLIRDWHPPMNIDKNPSASRALRDARAVMAAEAAAWRPPAAEMPR